jgi:hypothetical protein
MKRLSGSILALVLAALPIVASPADGGKTLTATAGTVTYGATKNPTTRAAANSGIPISDNDYVQTAADGEANIGLPDSSVVLIGRSSLVQMQSFDNASSPTKASFYVVGKVRFTVRHPAGAQANYTFTTATGQIAVRGTVGDINALEGPGGAPGGLQVNVYALSNPTLPVQVTLTTTGQTFTLAAGQSLVATAAGGVITGSVTAITQSLTSPFSEFGAANTTGAAAGAGAAGGAAGAAGGTAGVTAAAVAAGTAAAVTVVSNSNKPTNAPTATPSTAPTAAPSTTSVPITISGHPRGRPTPLP